MTNDTISISDGGVGPHNIRYFCSNEHPEQVDVRKVFFAAGTLVVVVVVCLLIHLCSQLKFLHANEWMCAVSDLYARLLSLSRRAKLRKHEILLAVTEELLALSDTARMHILVGGDGLTRAPLIYPPLSAQADIAPKDRWHRTPEQQDCVEKVCVCFCFFVHVLCLQNSTFFWFFAPFL